MSMQLTMTQAIDHLPLFVAQKLQMVAEEEAIEEFTLYPKSRFRPLLSDDPTPFVIPQAARQWICTGGLFWVLVSDGETFLDPIPFGTRPTLEQVQSGFIWLILHHEEQQKLMVVEGDVHAQAFIPPQA